jgi:hypothetical protein
MTALVRIDRLRGTLYEDQMRQLLQAVPDFRILAHSTGFDPIDDIDSFFMASPRPQYIQYTFLAVRHQKTQDEIKDVLDRRFKDPVPWETKGEFAVRKLIPDNDSYQDPRQIMLARPGLTIVGREGWLDRLAEELPEDSPLREEREKDAKPQDEAPPEEATLLDGLAQIERAADDENAIAVMSAQGLVYKIPGLGRMTFEGVRLAVTNPDSPTVDVDLKFEDAEHANKFANSCGRLRSRIKKSTGMDGFIGRQTGFAGLIDRLKCRADDDYVNIHAVYSAEEIKRLADLAAPWMPKPRALDKLPPPPPPIEPEPQAAPDAGSEAPADVGFEQKNGAPKSAE